jgi:anti-anti-sigma factor
MDIEKEQVGDAHVVTAHGRLDGIYSTAFANEVGALISGTHPKILIDFADIDHVTSAGLRAVLILVKKAKASGGVFALCGVNEQVREILDTSGFDAMFNIPRPRRRPRGAAGVAGVARMERQRNPGTAQRSASCP